MALSLQQNQKLLQTQRLIMTPQMQQSIQLLQMSSLDLEQLATQEMMENPFLELSDDADESEDDKAPETEDSDLRADSEDASPDDYSEPDAETSNSDAVVDDIIPDLSAMTSDTVSTPEAPDTSTSDFLEKDHFEDVDVNWDDCYDGAESRVYSAASSDEEDRDFTEYVAVRENLFDSLKWQLHVCALDKRGIEIGDYIIGSMDDDGYLRVPLEELAEDIKCSVEDVERVLKVIQTFDPVGVGARNLAECLRLQLVARGVKNPLVFEILDHHFDFLQKKKFKEIARTLKVTQDEVRDVFHMISHLEPKPGRSRSSEQTKYIQPDVYVKKVDDRYMIFLQEGRMTGLRINRYYQDVLMRKDAALDGKEKEFAQDKYRSAVWLIKNIEKRKSTILKVTEAIMDFQKEFLEKGTKALRPLTLKEVAEVVGMHESTVARVTSNKYVETPRGIFELKYFFSPGLETESGEDASSTSIKEMLRQMISAENPAKPLSDQKLAEMIRLKGINIARRTVAKYREQLKILSAKLRKEVA
ncbi:MAG: RNA polymerase factor sigma-54 [Candidatus Sumerlaeaceae bacterium]|nr:RNA polymerase factor sigma-54 [Candidatus Sumerlaeaceae bacterium]